MALVTAIDGLLDHDQFMASQGQALDRPEMKRVARWATDEAQGLLTPGIVYECLAVRALDGTQAQVGDTVFDVGRHADLLAPAREAFVGVCTIGPQLEERARELGSSGRALEGFLLGEVGVFAVGGLIQRAHEIVETEAAQRGWGVGAELAPGQLAGWKIEEQRTLCGLLDIDSVGVRVTDTGMLVPQKSASFMIGIGPGYASAVVRSPCEFCDQGATCRWRH